MTIPPDLEIASAGTLSEALRGFPASAVPAVQRFLGHPTTATLNGALRPMLEFYLPRAIRRSLDDVPGTIRLREDLGIDSLALAEALFKWDDLFAVPIESREAADVRTLDDLVAFLAEKMGLPDAPAPAS